MSAAQLDDTWSWGGDARLLPDLRDTASDTDGGIAGFRLEHVSDGVWAWGYGTAHGLAMGIDEGILAIGRAIGQQHGAGAQKGFLLKFIDVILSEGE
jgi:hypothetical protein